MFVNIIAMLEMWQIIFQKKTIKIHTQINLLINVEEGSAGTSHELLHHLLVLSTLQLMVLLTRTDGSGLLVRLVKPV